MAIVIGLAGILLSGCDRLSVKKSMADESYELVDQEGQATTFPEAYSGHVMLVGMFTHTALTSAR